MNDKTITIVCQGMRVVGSPMPWEDTVMHECDPPGKHAPGPVTPMHDGDPSTARDPRHVYCLLCSADWIEEDPRKLAQIWWSRGAYEGRCITEAEATR